MMVEEYLEFLLRLNPSIALHFSLPVFSRYFSFTDKKSSRKYSSSPNSNEISPVVIYTNADTDKINIFADNRKKAGVYR